MCIPCCGNCYTKYLTEDGQPDDENMNKIFGEGWKIFKKKIDADSVYGKYYLSRDKELPTTYHIETLDGNVKEFCTCYCHVKNSCVMH